KGGSRDRCCRVFHSSIRPLFHSSTPPLAAGRCTMAPGNKPARWRFLRGWSEAELRALLAAVSERHVNFDCAPEEMTRENGWTVDGADTTLGVEAPGPPVADGLYERAKLG